MELELLHGGPDPPWRITRANESSRTSSRWIEAMHITNLTEPESNMAMSSQTVLKCRGPAKSAGKAQREFSAPVGAADYRNFTAVGFHDHLDDREPKPGAGVTRILSARQKRPDI